MRIFYRSPMRLKFALTCILLMWLLVFSWGSNGYAADEDGREVLDRLADRMEQLASEGLEQSGTLSVTSFNLVWGRETLRNRSLHTRSGMVCLNKNYKDDGELRSVSFVNPRYYAKVSNQSEGDWMIRELVVRYDDSDGYHREALQNSRSHPAEHYCRMGQAWLPSFLRTAEVIKGPDEVDGGLLFHLRGDTAYRDGTIMGSDSDEAVCVDPILNRLLFRCMLRSTGELSELIRFDWDGTPSDQTYPKGLEVILPKNATYDDLKSELPNPFLRAEWAYRPVADFDEAEVYLPHYGLPEIEAQSRMPWWPFIVAFGLVVAVFGFRLAQRAKA